MLRVIAVVAAVIAVIAFAIGTILAGSATASTAADAVRWIDGGLIATAASLGFFELSTITDRPIP